MDFRTKVTDLPLLEDREQIETVLALSKDGKLCRIDGSDVGGGSICHGVDLISYYPGDDIEYTIKNKETVLNCLNTGGVLHVLVSADYKVVNLEIILHPDITGEPQSLEGEMEVEVQGITHPDISIPVGLISFDHKELIKEFYVCCELFYYNDKLYLRIYMINTSDLENNYDPNSSRYKVMYQYYPNCIYDYLPILDIYIEEKAEYKEPLGTISYIEIPPS